MKPFLMNYNEMINFIDKDKPIRVYRNLHKKCFSVKQGVVRFHTRTIFLDNVDFIVNEKGRARVLAEKRKNIHAYVQGLIFEPYSDKSHQPLLIDTANYDPYKFGYFYTSSGPIHKAYRCVLWFLNDNPNMIVLNHPSSQNRESGE